MYPNFSKFILVLIKNTILTYINIPSQVNNPLPMNTIKNRLNAEKLARVSEVLKAIAHPIRLNVLEELQEHKRLSVSELMDKTGIAQSLLSNHLIRMKDKGILKSTRDKQKIFYELVDEHILKIFNCLEDCSLV